MFSGNLRHILFRKYTVFQHCPDHVREAIVIVMVRDGTDQFSVSSFLRYLFTKEFFILKLIHIVAHNLKEKP